MSRTDYIKKFIKEKKRMPSVEELATALKVSERTAMHEIVSFNATYKKDSQKPATKQIRKVSHTASILRIFLILLSAMAFSLSVYFTGLWFSGKFPTWVAGAISITMVLFMVIAPQTIRFIKNRAVKAVTCLAFSVALIFSMGSTISGQYEKTTQRIQNEPDKAYIFNQLLQGEEEILAMIEEARKDKAVHQETIRYLSGSEEARKENWQSIATERKYISSYDERIDSLRKELTFTRSQKIDNGIIEEKRDFYSFISSITGRERTFIEFLISSLPAVFIDIVSALCLYLALFIKGR